EIGGKLFRARHFELELFAAVLQAKPVLLCALPDFSPDEDTREFLECLTQSQPDPIHKAGDMSDLITTALRFCERVDHQGVQVRFGRGPALVRTLSMGRAAYASIRSHKILFPFLGPITTDYKAPDLDRARQALQESKAQTNMHLQMSRLWVAIRELLP